MKQNCWDYKKCGREPGGENEAESGVCPAATSIANDGVNCGKNGGRFCWKITGTYCQGEVSGTFAQKYASCVLCDFFAKVLSEEGQAFQKV